jgi:hypothetical protein
MVFGKWRIVPDGVLGEYCSGTRKVWGYLDGTIEEMEVVMCD